MLLADTVERGVRRCAGLAHREGLPAGELKRRAKQVTEDDWAAKAVQEAIDAAARRGRGRHRRRRGSRIVLRTRPAAHA